MFQIKKEIKWSRLLILWTVSIFIGWSLIIYPGLTLREVLIYSWKVLPSLAWTMFIRAFILGAVIGILQYIAFRLDINLSWRWILVSALSYGMSTPLAFLISSAVLGYPDMASGGGAVYISLPLAFTMLIAGCLMGFVQAYYLRNPSKSF